MMIVTASILIAAIVGVKVIQNGKLPWWLHHLLHGHQYHQIDRAYVCRCGKVIGL